MEDKPRTFKVGDIVQIRKTDSVRPSKTSIGLAANTKTPTNADTPPKFIIGTITDIRETPSGNIVRIEQDDGFFIWTRDKDCLPVQ